MISIHRMLGFCLPVWIAAVMFAGSAPAATVGFTLAISVNGNENKPTMLLTNDSISALLTKFTLTIGDTSNNFDRFDPIPSAPVGGTATGVSPDTTDGGVRSDLLEIDYTGFDPTESSTWAVDLDLDNTNVFLDFRTLLFNNGSAPNSVATALFSDGQTASFTLPDGSTSQQSYTFDSGAAVPLPATLPLLTGGLGLLGLIGWRRRQTAAYTPLAGLRI